MRTIRRREGQAATEFIMTYGWALLAVLVAIGALAYFGIINPGKYLPERCILAPGINCKDYMVLERSIDKGLTVNLTIENKLQETVRIQQVTVTPKNGNPTICTIISGIVFVQENSSRIGCTLPATTSPGVNSNAMLNVQIVYSGIAGGFNHTNTGEIQAKVQS